MSVRPITDTLRQIAGGEFIDKSSDMMAELVRAVDEQRGQGSITLKITVKRAIRHVLLLWKPKTFKKDYLHSRNFLLN